VHPHPLPPEPFANSLGLLSGTPEPIEIEFDASETDYIKEREWHRSQEFGEREDGSLVMRLCVCNDWAPDLVLSFGRLARITPASLARDIHSEFEGASGRYARPRFEMLKVACT